MKITDLRASYGASQVLHGINFEIGTEPVGIVGRNGMGKTTVCAALTGMGPRVSGRIEWQGQDLSTMNSTQIARAGIAIVPQGRRIFKSLTVEEHLLLVDDKVTGKRWTIPGIYELFPRLAERRKNYANQLSGGEQQMLAIGRALMRQPSFLILDEPSEGLAPVIVQRLVDVLNEISASGIKMLIVEQNLRVAAAVAPRLLVMVSGDIALDIPSAQLLEDEAMQSQYLGVGQH